MSTTAWNKSSPFSGHDSKTSLSPCPHPEHLQLQIADHLVRQQIHGRRNRAGGAAFAALQAAGRILAAALAGGTKRYQGLSFSRRQGLAGESREMASSS